MFMENSNTMVLHPNMNFLGINGKLMLDVVRSSSVDVLSVFWYSQWGFGVSSRGSFRKFNGVFKS